jgi:hypothetical protein
LCTRWISIVDEVKEFSQSAVPFAFFSVYSNQHGNVTKSMKGIAAKCDDLVDKFLFLDRMKS